MAPALDPRALETLLLLPEGGLAMSSALAERARFICCGPLLLFLLPSLLPALVPRPLWPPLELPLPMLAFALPLPRKKAALGSREALLPLWRPLALWPLLSLLLRLLAAPALCSVVPVRRAP